MSILFPTRLSKTTHRLASRLISSSMLLAGAGSLSNPDFSPFGYLLEPYTTTVLVIVSAGQCCNRSVNWRRNGSGGWKVPRL